MISQPSGESVRFERSQPGRWIVGVDIGGTNIVVGTIAMDGGEPVACHTLPTEAALGSEHVVRKVAAMVEKTIAETVDAHEGTRADIAGVGIGSPGPLDRERGMVLNTPNLGWTNLPLRDLISEAVDLPATLDNDANCATYGEWWQGRGSRCQQSGWRYTGHGHRWRHSSQRGNRPWRLRCRRRNRPHDHRVHGP